MTTATKKKALSAAKLLRPHVDAVLLATAMAQIEHERCDKIQRQLLGSGRYGGDGNPRHTYLMPDEATDRYFADLDAAYREAGYKDLKPNHCPALIAEELQRKAERALIEASADVPGLEGITLDKLFCFGDGLNTYRKYIDLLIGLVVNSPGYTNPLHRNT